MNLARRSAKLLDLAYDPGIPRATLAAMERIGRRLGLPLDVLERLGQDASACEAFTRAARTGEARTLLPTLLAGPAARA